VHSTEIVRALNLLAHVPVVELSLSALNSAFSGDCSRLVGASVPARCRATWGRESVKCHYYLMIHRPEGCPARRGCCSEALLGLAKGVGT
jgi:hypothetical protein